MTARRTDRITTSVIHLVSHIFSKTCALTVFFCSLWHVTCFGLLDNPSDLSKVCTTLDHRTSKTDPRRNQHDFFERTIDRVLTLWAVEGGSPTKIFDLASCEGQLRPTQFWQTLGMISQPQDDPFGSVFFCSRWRVLISPLSRSTGNSSGPLFASFSRGTFRAVKRLHAKR